MLSGVWKAILEALFGAFRGWLADRRAEQAQKDLGAAKAGQETQGVVADVADKQAQNNAGVRDAGAIAGRLRADAERTDSSGAVIDFSKQ